MRAKAATPAGGSALGDAGPTPSSSGPSVEPDRLDRLQDFESPALREEWRRLHRSEPPRLSRDLLIRAIAYRMQELELGSLPRWARQTLAGAAVVSDPGDEPGSAAPKPPEPILKPGARLVREWHGRTHTVIALHDAFEFEGRRYRSLTQIAREITGAHWSGPRFFGLVKCSSAGGPNGTGRRDNRSEDPGLPVKLPEGASISGTRPDVVDAGAEGDTGCVGQRRSKSRSEDQAHG